MPSRIAALEVAVRRGDDAHVDGHPAVGAERLDHALLQHAKQLRLEADVHVADLVEEERALVGRLELADAIRVRAAEGAAHVAEELALEELGGDRACS